ncbi:WD40-repeat-containing domain protein [Chytriomyces cf. hyalinus JEL632]|nr:WD40-repeat-containing domain protein [Chytriomyces cf. hyalinus JEL632]
MFVRRGAHRATASGDAVWSCAFHDQGDFVATCNMDHTAKLWDVNTSKCKQTFRGHADSRKTKTLSLWDARTGTLLTGIVKFFWDIRNVSECWRVWDVGGRHSANRACCFLAVASNDGTTKMYNVRDRERLRDVSTNDDAVQGDAFDRSGEFLVTRGSDCTFRVFQQ